VEIRQERFAFFATAVFGLCLASSALAQDKPSSGGDRNELTDIVVTARRVQERLQDVPVSISVFNQQQLDDRRVVDTSSLADNTPGLSASSNFGPLNASFAIRGFVQDNFTSPSVGVYFADVISPRGAASVTSGDGAAPGSFFDLQNVQVLKGPQGTLFGRNTTGGAILLVPQRPTYEFGGYVEASAGDFDMRRYQGVLNLPLSENYLFRVSIDHMQRGGYLDNIGAFGPPHLADTDYTSARLSFLAQLMPNLENYSILTYVHSDTNGFTQRVTGCNPNAVISVPAVGQTLPTGQYDCAQVARLNAANDFYAVENSLPKPSNKLEQWQFIDTTTGDVTDHFTIKNIFSYAQLRNDSQNSVFGNYWVVNTNVPVPGNTVRPGFLGQVINPAQISGAPDAPLNHQNTISEELQFHGDALNRRLQWQAGLYYEDSAPVDGFTGTMGQNNGQCSHIGFDPTTHAPIISQCALPYNFLSGLSRDLRTTTFIDKAVYSQGTYALTDKLGMTAGLRYTDDKSSSASENFSYTYFNNNLVNTSCTNRGTALPDCITNQRQHSSATTGVMDLEYRPVEDLMTYAKYSRGYRQGIVNPRGVPPYDSIGPESVNTYEIGLKSSWHGAMPAVLNLAIHYNDFQHQQLLISFLNAAGNTNASACACGKSRIYGAELDGGVDLFEGFRITGALAYLHTELLEFQQPALPPGFLQAVPGNTVGLPLEQSPKWKGSLTAAYTLPIPKNLGEITTAATYTYTDSYYAKTSILGLIPSYGLLNLNLNWHEIGGGPVDLSLFVTNVTDKKYFTFATDLYDSVLGFASEVQGVPRMYGASVRYRFGAQ